MCARDITYRLDALTLAEFEEQFCDVLMAVDRVVRQFLAPLVLKELDDRFLYRLRVRASPALYNVVELLLKLAGNVLCFAPVLCLRRPTGLKRLLAISLCP